MRGDDILKITIQSICLIGHRCVFTPSPSMKYMFFICISNIAIAFIFSHFRNYFGDLDVLDRGWILKAFGNFCKSAHDSMMTKFRLSSVFSKLRSGYFFVLVYHSCHNPSLINLLSIFLINYLWQV